MLLDDPAYSLNDNAGDESMSRFDISRVPTYTFSVLKDIVGISNQLNFHLVPWSPVSYPASASGSRRLTLS